MRINRHDTNGTKPLLGKGELGYDDYVAGGDVGRVYVGTGSENIALAERLESNMMTKAQFNALAEERKANRAGSGFDEMGKGIANALLSVNEGIWTSLTSSNIFYSGRLYSDNAGISKTLYPLASINGVRHRMSQINISGTATDIQFQLPTAPNIYPYDTVLTTEQINSGVIKHADASNSGLIINGKFDVDTSGWNNNNNTVSLSSVDGKLQVRYITNSWTYQSILTVVGKKYKVSFSYRASGGGVYAYFRIGTYVSDQSLYAINTQSTISTTYEIEFTATTSTTFIHCGTSNTAGQYAEFDNIAVYPADAISRSDLVFLESWHEDISEKNFVYPLGNVQYLGANTDGLTGIANGAFTGFETYSLFGNWQTPSALIGKGYVWSSLTEVQKRAFIANPENNCYLDGDKTIQVRYRVRVLIGISDTINPFKAASGAAYLALNENGANSSFLINAKGKQVLSNETKDYANRVTTGSYGYEGANTVLGLNTVVGDLVALNTFGTPSNVAYEGKCFALPIALVHRRNQGMYHPTYNPNGTKKASDGNFWYNTAVSFTSISDCFDPSKLLTASGYIGSVSGRPDGLFYDQVHESDITDLRNSSKKVEDYNRLISREFNKLVGGTTRGKEGEWKVTRVVTTSSTYSNTINAFTTSFNFPYSPFPVDGLLGVGSGSNLGALLPTSFVASYCVIIDSLGVVRRGVIWVSSGGTTYIRVNGIFTTGTINIVVFSNTAITKSNTLLHCDIIGNPSNYPTSWKESGVFGTPLIVAEDGTSLLPDGVRDSFKLSRKANATPILCLRSTDSGATWTSFTPTFSTTTNEITLTDEPAANLVMVYYQTKTIMAVPVVNSEVLEIGEVYAGNTFRNLEYLGASFMNTLIGKTSTNSNHPVASSKSLSAGLKGYQSTLTPLNSYATEYAPKHEPIQLFGSASPAAKVFPYLTRTNGKAYLNLVFKEMKHNGTSWGDDAKFNIVDNVSTTTDNNAQTVLIGQKTVELPYFIAGDE